MIVIADNAEMVNDDLSRMAPAAIGRRVALLREAYGMTPTAFARFVGWTPQALNNYEKEGKRPNLDQALLLCQATGVTLDWIYRGIRSGLPVELAEKIPRSEAA